MVLLPWGDLLVLTITPRREPAAANVVLCALAWRRTTPATAHAAVAEPARRQRPKEGLESEAKSAMDALVVTAASTITWCDNNEILARRQQHHGSSTTLMQPSVLSRNVW